MKKRIAYACLYLLLLGNGVYAQQINPSLLKNTWPAYWIAAPNTPPTNYGVYFFRKQITLPSKPNQFIIHISADNRYQLFINGKLVSIGPARSDLYFWKFATIDIAPYLQQGINTIATAIWNEGHYRPEAQISHRTAWVLVGDDALEKILNTNSTWKSYRCMAYRPLPGIDYSAYYVAGPGEIVDMHQFPLQWQQNNFDDSQWQPAQQIGWSGAKPKGIGDINEWMLIPDPLPAMELKLQRMTSIRSAIGVTISHDFLSGKAAFQVPAYTTATILLDQGVLTNAYVHLLFSGGNGATITCTYAEALFEKDKEGKPILEKGNRNDIANKIILGRKDSIISSGVAKQAFNSLAWRTFRYIQLNITTQNEPISIEDFYNTFIGYPYQQNASVQTTDTLLQKILNIGWHTARLCAIETFMDCPYYEELQYIGDSRIQALIGLYNSGDDRLVKNALNQMDHSRIAEGITLSRHPSFTPQQIPTFSLWYIGMLADYWKYRGDSAFIANKLQGVRNILWFFQQYQQADGTLRKVPYWMFTDWVDGYKGWNGGTAPYGKDGSSAILDLQLLWAYQLAASLEAQMGMPAYAKLYNAKAIQLQTTIQKKYWYSNKALFADTDEGDQFSQHANALAILTHTITGKQATALAQQLLHNKQLAPASIYFKYYLYQALVMAGLGNDYLQWLDIWKENIAMGLTTWAETSDINGSRSDCHAWGASPNIEVYRTILGIDSDAPGFKKVKITPHLGNIIEISGQMPHPNGMLHVAYKKNGNKWTITIVLPKTVTGQLVWNNKIYVLQSGNNVFALD
ncbi:MAG: alpha-rhamnosidase [Hydrotalea flava]|nr:alpha-rhamnosidase [Hydrotalea flava]NIM37461.1 alpha-rhamnosidase [Hydrotalea flava]NIN02629.1 alpha-rhamnosidase [Hydrotalea flava]NIN14300.1 alpha-rhamnosidase [Hydrotalea flava]NIO93387.1 alpha-rhamnosidase [Hydrotalea flava]